MSVALYRARKRIKSMQAESADVVVFVVLQHVLAIIDGEQEDEQERQFFRPLVSAEPIDRTTEGAGP